MTQITPFTAVPHRGQSQEELVTTTNTWFSEVSGFVAEANKLIGDINTSAESSVFSAPDWVAQPYDAHKTVVYTDSNVYISTEDVLATDIPSVSDKWKKLNSSGLPIVSRGNTTTIIDTDGGKYLKITASGVQNITDISNLSNGWFMYFENATTSTVTLTCASGDTVMGLNALAVYGGGIILLMKESDTTIKGIEIKQGLNGEVEQVLYPKTIDGIKAGTIIMDGTVKTSAAYPNLYNRFKHLSSGIYSSTENSPWTQAVIDGLNDNNYKGCGNSSSILVTNGVNKKVYLDGSLIVNNISNSGILGCTEDYYFYKNNGVIYRSGTLTNLPNISCDCYGIVKHNGWYYAGTKKSSDGITWVGSNTTVPARCYEFIDYDGKKKWVTGVKITEAIYPVGEGSQYSEDLITWYPLDIGGNVVIGGSIGGVVVVNGAVPHLTSTPKQYGVHCCIVSTRGVEKDVMTGFTNYNSNSPSIIGITLSGITLTYNGYGTSLVVNGRDYNNYTTFISLVSGGTSQYPSISTNYCQITNGWKVAISSNDTAYLARLYTHNTSTQFILPLVNNLTAIPN